MILPSSMLLLPILFPVFAGILSLALPIRRRWVRHALILGSTALNSLFLLLLIVIPTAVLRFGSGNFPIILSLDGLGRFFAGLIAFLWPFATLYAFEYMENDKHEGVFFLFYLISYGMTAGVCLSGSLLSMYIFYEFLTLATVPLVLHGYGAENRYAARKYALYSIGGAAFALIGIIYLLSYGYGSPFAYGGILGGEGSTALLLMFVLMFFGFGVKAAVFPFHGWLPSASVAPTPVTALLHAVAVVKAGIFALMRLTYYVFGAEMLRGTAAQWVTLGIALFTVVFGAAKAVREHHFKRRLAYSTVSNLSYILSGVLLMTPAGFAAGLCHMAFHAVMKIGAFFCAGAFMHRSGREYVFELYGIGRRMPRTFGLFTLFSLSLMGVPLLCGFVSKFGLLTAGLSDGGLAGYLTMGALLLAALLCAVYTMTVVIRAFFPGKGQSLYEGPDGDAVSDPGYRMLLPMGLFAAVCVLLGVFSSPMTELVSKIAGGLL